MAMTPGCMGTTQDCPWCWWQRNAVGTAHHCPRADGWRLRGQGSELRASEGGGEGPAAW